MHFVMARYIQNRYMLLAVDGIYVQEMQPMQFWSVFHLQGT